MNDGIAEIVLTDGVVVNENGSVRAAVAIADGRILAIGDERAMPPARRRISVSGAHILPGAIDVHVHFREPGLEHKEDWATGSAAAAVGGVTTVFDMPNTMPPTDSVAHFDIKHAAAAAKSHVDFGLYGLLGEHNLGELPALAEARRHRLQAVPRRHHGQPAVPQRRRRARRLRDPGRTRTALLDPRRELAHPVLAAGPA